MQRTAGVDRRGFLDRLALLKGCVLPVLAYNGPKSLTAMFSTDRILRQLV